MQDNILMSIIVPAYQIETYLAECVKSVENQNYNDYEIIIVDDGSKDNTPEIADELKKEFSNIYVIHQENQGLSEARNSGIKVAKGKYCVLLDGDDMFQPDTLIELAKCIEENNMPDVVISRFVTLDSLTGEIKECPFTFDKKRLDCISSVSMKFKEISHYWLAGWLFCVRLDYLKQHNLFFKKGLLHEDEEWMPRVALHAQSIAFNNVPYYCYRLSREGSITNKLNENRMLDSIRIINILQKELADDTYSDEAKEVMMHRIQTILFGTINKSSMYRKCKQYGKMVKQLESKIYLFKDSERIVYRLSYLLCRVIGIKKTGVILQHIVNKRNKKRL